MALDPSTFGRREREISEILRALHDGAGVATVRAMIKALDRELRNEGWSEAGIAEYLAPIFDAIRRTSRKGIAVLVRDQHQLIARGSPWRRGRPGS